MVIQLTSLIVDAAGLKFIDGAGMRELAMASKQARQAGDGLVLAALGPPGRQEEEGQRLAPTRSSPRLTRDLTARDRTGRDLPGPAWVRGIW